MLENYEAVYFRYRNVLHTSGPGQHRYVQVTNNNNRGALTNEETFFQYDDYGCCRYPCADRVFRR
ncbi:hypothetical protein D3C80_1619890 [compost metagenome]